ncbi:MAG: manganese catalase family protein [Bacillota bacterium]|jgi:spore coat protein JC
MWVYEKKLMYPVKATTTNPKLAKLIITQYGGPDGELSASLRYLNQRYTMPTNKTKALLTDIGTEELAHMEMVAAMVYQLTKNATVKQMEEAGMAPHFAEHGKALFYVDATGNPFTSTYIAAKDDPIADLTENLDAEQKARATYNNLLALSDDPGISDALYWLREREIVHIQRFGEALTETQEMFWKKVSR